MLREQKPRRNNEGSIYRRIYGEWMGQITVECGREICMPVYTYLSDKHGDMVQYLRAIIVLFQKFLDKTCVAGRALKDAAGGFAFQGETVFRGNLFDEKLYQMRR